MACTVIAIASRGRIGRVGALAPLPLHHHSPPTRRSSATSRRSSTRPAAPPGPCHGAAKGKNGFKLSLRGYDPQFDYEALLYDLSGRRFNRADPAPQPDARQADAAGAARRRAALRTELATTTRRSTTGSRRACRTAIRPRTRSTRLEVEPQRNLHDEARRDGDGEGHRALRRRHDARRHRRGDGREQRARRRGGRRRRVKGARVGEARCWCATRASSSTVPVTVLNPKPASRGSRCRSTTTSIS